MLPGALLAFGLAALYFYMFGVNILDTLHLSIDYPVIVLTHITIWRSGQFCLHLTWWKIMVNPVMHRSLDLAGSQGR